MLDFISSAYLGLRHSSRSLGEWESVTLARPAALGGARSADKAAGRVAALQGCECGISGPSTLHLAIDVFTNFLRQDIDLYWDAHLYPVLRCAIRLAARAQRLPPHDAGALAARLASRGTASPVMVTDGYCVDCGHAAPLAAYLAALEPHGGTLVVDDTQALGIFGNPGAGPFGEGGGGSPRAQEIRPGAPMLVLASLAKAFGAPMGVLSGPRRLLEGLGEDGFSRQHCSPASIPAARCAWRAVITNEIEGMSRRHDLARLLRLFRALCRQHGVPIADAFHPVQSLVLGPTDDPLDLVRAAHAAGLSLAACRGPGGASRLRLIVTARHSVDEIEAALVVLSELPLTRSGAQRRLRRPEFA